MKAPGFFRSHPFVSRLALALVISFFVSLFFFIGSSPLYAHWNTGSITLDSNFAMYAGRLLYEGKTPYVDFYDHKGLYQWVLVGLALKIGGRTGVFFLEWIVSGLTLLLLFEIAVFIAGYHFWPLFMAASLYAIWMAFDLGGNQEGEYLLPFVAAAFLLYLHAFQENSLKKELFASFVCGIEMGLALNSRPLDGIFGGALTVGYFAYYLKKERNWRLPWNILSALAGLALSLLPFYLVAWKFGFFSAMMKAVFVQSVNYIKNESGPERDLGLILLIFLTVFALFYYWRAKRRRDLLGEFYLVDFLLVDAVMFAVIRYGHYLLGGLPLLVSASETLLHYHAVEKKTSHGFHTLSYLSLAAAVLIAIGYLTNYYSGAFYHDGTTYAEAVLVQQDLKDAIPDEDLSEPGKVFALNGNPSLYLMGNITIDERFSSNQSWWSEDNGDVLPEIQDYLAGNLPGKEAPKWVLAFPDEVTKKDFNDVLSRYYVARPFADGHTNGQFSLYERLP
jgi:hypothetical protein